VSSGAAAANSMSPLNLAPSASDLLNASDYSGDASRRTAPTMPHFKPLRQEIRARAYTGGAITIASPVATAPITVEQLELLHSFKPWMAASRNYNLREGNGQRNED